MDKRELLRATLQGEKTERIPCGFWHHFSEVNKYGSASVKAHLDFYQKTDSDMLKIMNEHMYVLDRKVTSIEDWKLVRQQKFEDTPYVDFMDECKMIKKEMPSDVPLLATLHGVLVSAYHATEKPGGFVNPNNKITTDLKKDPHSVGKGLQTIADTLVVLVEKLASIGIDGIYYAALGGEDYRFTQEFFEKYVKPFDAYVIDAIRSSGMLSFMHICKDKVMLPAYQGINADVFNWAVNDCKYSLSDGRMIFPGKTLLGGFDDRSGVLVDGSKMEIIKEGDAIIQEIGREKFIFGADCTLPETVETWRINTVHDLAAKY